MRIIRFILSVSILLVSLASGAWGFFLFNSSKPIIIKYGTLPNFNLAYPFLGLAVILLIVAALVMPRSMKKKKITARQTAVDAVTKAQQAAHSLKVTGDGPSGSTDVRKTAPTTNPADFESAPFPQAPQTDRDEKTLIDDELSDNVMMDHLIVIEQSTLTREIVIGLLQKYYPEIIPIVNRIHDEKSLDTFGRHIISIARNQIKLSDKSLTDNQFSIFQNKMFDEENKEVLRIYAPTDRSNLTTEQQTALSKAVDMRNWEGLQRKVRAKNSDDWVGFKVKGGKELLEQTAF